MDLNLAAALQASPLLANLYSNPIAGGLTGAMPPSPSPGVEVLGNYQDPFPSYGNVPSTPNSTPSTPNPYQADVDRYGAQEDAARGRERASLGSIRDRQPYTPIPEFANLKQSALPLGAALIAGFLDPSGRTTQSIVGNFNQGFSAQAHHQNELGMRADQDAIRKSQLDAQIADLEADHAARRRAEAVGNLNKEDQRKYNEELAQKQFWQKEFDVAQQRYFQADNPKKMRQAYDAWKIAADKMGGALAIPTDEQFAKDLSDLANGNVPKARKEWSDLVSFDLKNFGYVDDNPNQLTGSSRAQELELQRQEIAARYGIDPSHLVSAPTLDTLAKQKQTAWKTDIDRRFKHLVEKDRVTLAQAASRLDIAKQGLLLSRQRLQLAQNQFEWQQAYNAYTAATGRWNAEISAARASLGNLDQSSTLGKKQHEISMMGAELAALEDPEGDDKFKAQELMGKMDILRSELSGMQDKVLGSLGVDPSLGMMADAVPFGMGAALKQSAIENRQSEMGKAVPGQAPAGPSANSKTSVKVYNGYEYSFDPVKKKWIRGRKVA